MNGLSEAIQDVMDQERHTRRHMSKFAMRDPDEEQRIEGAQLAFSIQPLLIDGCDFDLRSVAFGALIIRRLIAHANPVADVDLPVIEEAVRILRQKDLTRQLMTVLQASAEA